MPEPCLAIEGLTKRFGGFYALNELQMEVAHGAHPCADRAERRRQDDPLQPGHRRARRRRRAHHVRGRAGRRRAAVAPHAQGHRAHVPEHPPVPAADRARNRDGRRALPLLSVDVAGVARRPCCSVRSARRRRSAACATNALELLEFSGSPTSATPRPPTCLTATSAGSRSRARWRPSRGCCCSTSRRPA